MAERNSETTSAHPTCLCEMCICGNHECPQQMSLKLKGDFRRELSADTKCKPEERNLICKGYSNLPESDLYHNTTYKHGYCSHRNVVDAFPLEQFRHVANLKPEAGDMEKKSISARSYVPWHPEEIEICRAKLQRPISEVNENSKPIADAKKIVTDDMLLYYFPPHCAGDELPSTENVMAQYKRHFNLGPPSKKTQEFDVKPRKPFSKFTSYKLDYVPHECAMRKPKTIQSPKRSSAPMSSDTTHQSDYSYPPQDFQAARPSRSEPPAATLGLGKGPMEVVSSAMLDYVDHDVAQRPSMRPKREVFEPPRCKLEVKTTHNSDFQWWDEVPVQPEVPDQLRSSVGNNVSGSKDNRHLVTTYQEDFDGLRAALCPAGRILTHGPKVLEPNYRLLSAKNDHERYQKIGPA